jgi:nucleoside-specific outer membrane channel protein Tsx
MKSRRFQHSASLAMLLACGAAHAAEWSDTSISYRYGNKFAEPYIDRDISKSIINLSSASGYKYGKNYFSVDLLFSSADDPSSAGARTGAREVYVVYRNTLDLGKISGAPIAFGPVRGGGATFGFDFNNKNDAGYNSKKQMLVLGPTLMLNVPGFLDVGVLAIWESNAPYNTFSHVGTPRYRYKLHPMLAASWGIPFDIGIPLSFEGFAEYIASKGRNEFGGPTAPETNIDMQIMYDLSDTVGMAKNTFKIGLEYQYWKNKFGNPSSSIPGAFARTPMVRLEYHF